MHDPEYRVESRSHKLRQIPIPHPRLPKRMHIHLKLHAIIHLHLQPGHNRQRSSQTMPSRQELFHCIFFFEYFNDIKYFQRQNRVVEEEPCVNETVFASVIGDELEVEVLLPVGLVRGTTN